MVEETELGNHALLNFCPDLLLKSDFILGYISVSKSNIQSMSTDTVKISFTHSDVFLLGIAEITFLIDVNLKFFC